jgi:hypothetical protein
MSNQNLRVQACNIDSVFDDPSVFTKDTLVKILDKMCSDVNSEFSKKFSELLHSNNIDGLLDLDISPLDYSDAHSYYMDNALYCFAKKYPYWKTSHDPKLNAMKTFIACEVQCMKANQVLINESAQITDSSVHSILSMAQRKILSILGDAPHITDLTLKFGPGATYGVTYNTSALDKLSSRLDVTESCYGLAEEFLRSCPGWSHNDDYFIVGPRRPNVPTLEKGDRLSFVPKTAKTDRPIGIGPLLNGLIQKGIGSAIRSKLKPILNLRDAQFRHRDLARKASIDNSLATVDLKSASDTISYGVICNLFPSDWFNLMDNARSHYYMIEDKWYPYHKFSAMGNGFTFELESLLFYSLAFASCKFNGDSTEEVSVYGDDIILPSTSYKTLLKVLSSLGFSINDEKSFADGPFRESCGGDFFLGCDVRPFYLKDKVTYRTLFLFHNYLTRTGYNYAFKKTFSFLKGLLSRDVVKMYASSNMEDDGVLYNPSKPRGSYCRIVTKTVGTRRSPKKRSHGIAYILYQNMLSYGDNEVSEPWFKTKKFRCKHRLYHQTYI